MLTWKLRITVLWIILAVLNPAAMILHMFEPGVIRDLMAGEWLGADAHDAGVQIRLAVNWLVPLAMAFLTLVLKDAVSRWTNVVLGAFVVWWSIGIWVDLLVGGAFGGAEFVGLVGSLIGPLILWHAWKWPHPREVRTPQQRQETTRL